MTAPGGRRAGARRWRLVRAHSDAVPASVRRFMARARRRRLRAAMPWLTIGGVLALIGLGTWIVYGTGLLGVREVRVSGTDILSEDDVREAAGVRDGVALARVDLDGIEERLAALAPVDHVIASRDWPGTIAIEVVERTPVAVVPQGAKYVLVDRHGVAFHTVSGKPGGLPLARVAKPGPDDADTRSAVEVLTALSPQLAKQLSAVVVKGPAEIELELRGGRVIVWGDSSQSDAKSQVATALLRKKGDRIDVSAPEVVTIR
ncbi:FtsQ-type POTRA domain-containing protein [Phytohabitans sp. ZYX-F-186]|uniref:FtsQ-type POTRA domain-containing protein n=1 Tax=Phytohabitans maris TaxID=3071409 RepID=A0ABU0ZBU8_9ACTN|nr:FtsQ-type POTRA domain-containing protein [Phytohabitans sp. ZYX-F-186]MDQ7904525.1 FtsQ-type POTRA domain-containing protein [Phytohabitans sp. ZYX-F-186]